jgi:V/A-type H+-transporting ATPase subunit C
MDRVGLHGATNAKAKAMLGRLLKEEDYLSILKLETVEEIINYLKTNTHYGDILKDEYLELEEYEVLMEHYFFKAHEKFCYFYIDNYREFFKAIICRYEVENLKLYLRTLSRNKKMVNLKSHLILTNIHTNLNYDDLDKATNIRDFMEGIKDTIYYKPLVPFLDEEPAQMIFHMEMVLDKFYFDKLYISATKLKKKDRDIMLELLGINIDILNIQWIFRGRRFFDISSEELFNFTLIHGRRYDEKTLKNLCYMELEDFRNLISKGDYKDLFQDKEYMMERAMERHIYNMLDEYTKKSSLSIALPIIFLFKFEYEMRDLFTIIEGVHYHFEDIGELLIREIGRDQKWP